MYGSRLRIVPNQPNPFRGTTSIGFYLPQEEQVVLRIMDATGKIVKSFEGNYGQGMHQVELGKNDLPGGGLYLQ
ncbi:MAG: T9SS type A sorting domain-containing protein [Saprospiraceae bacterium]